VLYVEQIRAARGLLDWSQSELAKRAGVSPVTVKRVEAGTGLVHGNADTVFRIQNALAQAGIIFIDADDGNGPGVRLAAVPRSRARKTR
jgi:transcriptional regulator with XRE-family HTH domain